MIRIKLEEYQIWFAELNDEEDERELVSQTDWFEVTPVDYEVIQDKVNKYNMKSYSKLIYIHKETQKEDFLNKIGFKATIQYLNSDSNECI